MNKKTWYFIIAIIIIALGAFFYLNSQKSGNGDNSNGEVFSLIEDKDNVLWNEDLNLDQAFIDQYTRNLEKARKNLEEAGEEITEGNKEAVQSYYNNIALFDSYLGNYQEAYDYYLKSLELYSDDRVVWLALGSLLMQMQAFESAEKAIDIGLEWNPYDDLGWTKKIGLYETWLGQNPESAQKIDGLYKEAIEKTNEDPLLVNNYADWLVRIGRKEEAIMIYEKLVEISPENEEAINRTINKLKE